MHVSHFFPFSTQITNFVRNLLAFARFVFDYNDAVAFLSALFYVCHFEMHANSIVHAFRIKKKAETRLRSNPSLIARNFMHIKKSFVSKLVLNVNTE